MATKKEKKLDHIQVKDNGIKLSQDIGDKLADAKTLLENEIMNGLLKSSNETNLSRYRIAQNINLRNYQYLSDKVIGKVKKDVKTSLKEDNTVNLTNKQVVNMSSQINKGLLFLQESAVRTYQDTLTNILLRCKSAGDLKEQLQKHIDSGIDVGVIYKDGKNYQFDTYWEMKARTDIQNDIGSNMVKTGQENGVIFYIAAYFGDCAKDHVEYQGKIYVDKNWESNAPKDRLEEIRSYINSHDIKTVQEVLEPPARFTTRPNCRHYFQYIDIDSVLGAKNNDDVNKLRDERNLNFNGKYKPEKYEALQKQRLNERKIREYKAELFKAEQVLKLEPNDKVFQIKMENAKANIRRIQGEQRALEKQYSNIERNYSREALKVKVDFNGGSAKIKVKFADSDNDRLINRKRIGLSKKSFEYVAKQSEDMLMKVKNDDKIQIEGLSDPRLYYENCLVREYYHEKLAKIKESIPDNLSLEEKARFAFEARTKIRLDARDKMEDLKGRALLPEGKTFEELLAHKMDAEDGKGLPYNDALQDIIDTCDKSNGKFDKLFKLKGGN